MDQNFQTSFIPKKPIIEKRVTATPSVSLLTILSIFILFTVLVATGGLYFYKISLNKKINDLTTQITLAQSRFEPDELKRLQTLDRRLNDSNQILATHIAVSPIFQTLGDITMKTIRYTKFSYLMEPDGKIDVKMSGVATGYRPVALQSDLFAKDTNLIDPVFSNLTLDDTGKVTFDLEFHVQPSFVNYKQMVLTKS